MMIVPNSIKLLHHSKLIEEDKVNLKTPAKATTTNHVIAKLKVEPAKEAITQETARQLVFRP